MNFFIKFISSIAVAMSLFTTQEAVQPDLQIISCAPAPTASEKFFANSTSRQDGKWTDPSTWLDGIVPSSVDLAYIKHAITIDGNINIAGINIGATGRLRFDPQISATLQSTKNIVDSGIIESVPANASIIHTIRFTGINENNFVPGTMDVIASNVGLWVMGSGQLKLKGTEKTSWTNAAAGINAGTSVFNVKATTGWLPGDEISVVPTAENDYSGFDDGILKSVSGVSLTLNSAVKLSHPKVNDLWTAEVMNLTRNVRIEGTATGRSHVFIRSTRPSSLEFVQLRYLGPRKNQGGDAATEAIKGMYALHIHHSMDGSRGMIVRGCVARDIGNNVYVPHVSHGVKMVDNIAYNILGSGFWWDEGFPESSHNILWKGNIVAKCDYVRRSQDVFDTDGGPVLSARAFMLNHGDDDTCINNVAVGVYGDPHDGGGYKWEAVNNDRLEGVWHFRSNLSHNIDAAGLIGWQNVQMNHHIDQYTVYYSREGLFLGAYANPYQFTNSTFYKATAVVHAASSTTGRIRFENSTFGDIVIEGSPLGGTLPVLFRNCTFTKLTDQVSSPAHNVDIIQSTGQVVHAGGSSEIIRIQPKEGQATRKAGSTTTNIPTFAPAIWGNGRGLKGEYFSNTTFSGTPAFVRTDSYLGFGEWGNGVHYKIGNTYSVRWTGYFQAQFNEKYTVSATAPGSVKMFINSVQYAGSASIDLKAGDWYSIKIEYAKTGNQRGGMELKWRSPSIEKFSPGGEFIPMCQLNDVPVSSLPIRDPVQYVPPTSIKEFRVYPIPNHGLFFIEVPKGKFQYKIINALGQVLENGQLPSNSKKVMDITARRPGVYMLEIITEKGDPIYKKIIKY